jgi:hypothetical protein
MARVVACVVTCTLAGAPREVSAEPCAPSAALDGDAVAVANVAAELNRLGVATNARLDGVRTDGCPSVAALVEVDRGGGIAVAVRDRTHRSEGRVVSDPALAAAWIDSWLRDDLDSSFPSTQAVEVVAPSSSLAPHPHAGVLARSVLAVDGEQTWSGNKEQWTGLAVAACTHVEQLGGACVGGRARYATQDVATALSAAHRTDLSLLATASYTVEIGRMRISPELGVGVGRMTTDRVEGCMSPMPMPDVCMDPSDPNCVMPPTKCDTSALVYVGDDLHAVSWTPRAAGAIRVAVPLFDHVWLDLGAQLVIAPGRHASSYPFIAGANAPPVEPAQDLSLPGEPLGAFTVGVGLRLGAP